MLHCVNLIDILAQYFIIAAAKIKNTRVKSLALILGLILGMSVSAQTKINWVKIQELEKKNKQTPKKVMIDVYATWCGPCKMLDARTFTDAKVASYLNDKYHPVKFDAETRDSVSLLGNSFKYVPGGRSGYNELAVALLQGQLSYPSIVFMNEKMEIIYIHRGFIPADQMYEMITYIGEDKYLEQLEQQQGQPQQ